VVKQEILEHRAAEGPADERCHHSLSQCRAPLSPNQKCEKLWTLPRTVFGRALQEVVPVPTRYPAGSPSSGNGWGGGPCQRRASGNAWRHHRLENRGDLHSGLMLPDGNRRHCGYGTTGKGPKLGRCSYCASWLEPESHSGRLTSRRPFDMMVRCCSGHRGCNSID